MENKKKNRFSQDLPLPQPSSSDLRGRQSVRTTFKLSETAIEALSVLSVHLGIKQKSLFDHLMEDMESLSLIAREIRPERVRPAKKIQKTYVVSRKTLSCLERTSKTFDTPRDALVEYSIQRLLPLIAIERKKHQKRKEVLGELTSFLKQGEEILKRSKEMLGEDDPLHDRFESAMAVLFNAYSDMVSFVEKGKIIESF